MSTLNSASTLADVNNALMDNASYAEDNSLPKANAFVTACTAFLVRYAFMASRTRDVEMRMSPIEVRMMRQEARDWIATQPGVKPTSYGNVVTMGTRDFRGEFFDPGRSGCGGGSW